MLNHINVTQHQCVNIKRLLLECNLEQEATVWRQCLKSMYI